MALDLDDYHGDLDALAELQRTLGELPPTVTAVSGSGEGCHPYFRRPPGSIRGTIGQIVVRARNYVVAPGSHHQSGGMYHWLAASSPDEIEVAELPAAWIDALRPSTTIGEVGVPDAEPAWLAAIDDETRLAAARAYLDGRPGEVQGESPPGTTWRTIANAIRGYAVRDIEGATAMAVAYGDRCDPPWDHGAISRHVRSAYARAHSPAWGESLMPDEARLDDVGYVAPTVEPEPTDRDAKRTPTPDEYGMDAAEFLTADLGGAEPWIVHGLIPEGMPIMLAGQPKARKSWIELYLAACIASGRPAFGRPVVRSRVLVISREDTPHETQRRLAMICRGLDVDASELRGWLRVECSRPLRLDDDDDVATLDAALAAYRPGVVMIDSLSRIHTRDENSRSDMAVVTNAWADLCTRHACTIMVLHHVTKVSDGRPLIASLRGTGDLGALVRVAIGVERVDDVTSEIATDGNLPDMAHTFRVRFVDRGLDGLAIQPGSSDPRHAVTIEIAPSAAAQDAIAEVARDAADDAAVLRFLRESAEKGLYWKKQGLKTDGPIPEKRIKPSLDRLYERSEIRYQPENPMNITDRGKGGGMWIIPAKKPL
jgi:hypothetical protein